MRELKNEILNYIDIVYFECFEGFIMGWMFGMLIFWVLCWNFLVFGLCYVISMLYMMLF